MVALPCSAPVIKPVELIDATAGLELDHVTLDAGEPSILAEACTEVPDAMGLVGTVIVTEDSAVAVKVTEPAPAEEATTV